MRILSPVSLLAMLFRRLPWFLFCLALGVRLGYWHDISLDPSNGYPLYHAVRGVPYSDAQSYDLSAAEVAAGGEVPEYWRARRPIYSYLLAALYTWTGPSFNVAILLNIVLGAVTVVLIFQIFARIFSVAVGLPVGIWAAFDPEQISGSMVIMTEPLGFFFLCWHFWLMVRAPASSKRDLFASGVLFAISNLTRTLTLFAFPFYFLGMVIQGLRRRWGIWRSGMFATVFFAGLFATLFPFMFAQWLRYGIFTLQDTTASHFYAATSPDYKAWDASIEQMADDMNLKDTKERYQFFMSKARKNLFKYPRTFVSKLIENSKIPFFKSISFVNSQPFRAEFFALSMLAILLVAFAPIVSPHDSWKPRLLHLISAAATLPIVLFAFEKLPNAVLFFIGLAALRSLVFPRNDLSFHVTGLYAGTLFTFGIFAFWDDRFLIYLQWLMVGLYFGGICFLVQCLSASLAYVFARKKVSDGSTSREETTMPTAGEFVFLSPTATKWCAGLLVLFGLTTFGRIMVLRTQRPEGEPRSPFISTEQARQVVKLIDERFPEALTPAEHQMLHPKAPATDQRAAQLVEQLVSSPSSFAVPAYLLWQLSQNDATSSRSFAFPSQGDGKDGDLVVIAGAPTRYNYYFPRGETSPNNWRFFTYRGYERSVFYFDGQIPGGAGGWHSITVFPKTLPELNDGEQLVLVGRFSFEPIRYQENLIEGIALIPWTPATNEIHFDRAVFAKNPVHVKRLTHWTTALSPSATGTPEKTGG